MWQEGLSQECGIGPWRYGSGKEAPFLVVGYLLPMPDFTSNTAIIEAPVADVRALLFDPASYTTWSSAIREVKVIASDDQGRATKVEMVIKAVQLKDRVTLDYDWSQGGNLLVFSLDEADMLTQMSGSYSVEALGDETKVKYELSVELSIPVPAMMRHKAEKETINLALKELKAHLENE